MRLLVISDIHGARLKIKELIYATVPDIIILPGDIPANMDVPTLVSSYLGGGDRDTYNKNLYGRFKNRLSMKQMRSAKKILDEIVQFNIPTIMIHGNSETKETRSWLELYSYSYPHLHWVADNYIKIDDILFVGHGWVPIMPGQSKEPTSGELDQDIVETILLDTLGRAKQDAEMTILISHAPPFGTDIDFLLHQQTHAGSFPVRKILDSGFFDGVISGHLHDSWGFVNSGQWWGINVGAAAEDRACLIDFETRKVRWFRNIIAPNTIERILYNRWVKYANPRRQKKVENTIITIDPFVDYDEF